MGSVRKDLKDSLVIGFALFSMFFGAGNVIFPPYLGLGCGREWVLGFLCYYLADIGLALLAMFAVLRSGSSDAITRPIGRIPARVLMSAVVLCIGPMLAIPRTAASTYEMSLQPLASGVSPVVFSVLFFLVILLLCLRESAVVDIVGKVLTPALLAGLLVLIVVGVVHPMGPVGEILSRPAADRYLRAGEVVIFAGGTGNPYFSTDTAAVLRAAEIQADMILLAKNIDGVYSADPKKDPGAVKYDAISYDQVLADHLQVMDLTATSLAMENHIPVMIFALADPQNILRAVMGERIGTIVEEETKS